MDSVSSDVWTNLFDISHQDQVPCEVPCEDYARQIILRYDPIWLPGSHIGQHQSCRQISEKTIPFPLKLDTKAGILGDIFMSVCFVQDRPRVTIKGG